jgi:hypothetical protein
VPLEWDYTDRMRPVLRTILRKRPIMPWGYPPGTVVLCRQSELGRVCLRTALPILVVPHMAILNLACVLGSREACEVGLLIATKKTQKPSSLWWAGFADGARRSALRGRRSVFHTVQSFRDLLNGPFYRRCGRATAAFCVFELFAQLSDFFNDGGYGVCCPLLGTFDSARQTLDTLEYRLHRWCRRRRAAGWRLLCIAIAILLRGRLPVFISRKILLVRGGGPLRGAIPGIRLIVVACLRCRGCAAPAAQLVAGALANHLGQPRANGKASFAGRNFGGFAGLGLDALDAPGGW